MENKRVIDFSIVIPSYNRKERLRQCLKSLFEQSYPSNRFEIIVIDDGSTDGTAGMLEELSKAHLNLKYHTQANQGPAVARNLGINKACASIIGFTDNDCILENRWVEKMLAVHRQLADVIAVGGWTEVDPKNIKAVVSQRLSDGAIEVIIDGKKETIFFPTCNVSLKKEYLGEGFNELFPLPAGEDLDFFWRLFKDGFRFSYQQDIRIFHNCNTNTKSFLKQAFMYGRGNYFVQYIHNDHPLLKEIKTRNDLYFILSLAVNFLKIPRFSYLQSNSLIRSLGKVSFLDKLKICYYFSLHKIMYLIGNTAEHLNVKNISKYDLKNNSQKRGFTSLKPDFIILDITHRCNLKCNICEIRKDEPIKELTTDQVKDLIKQSIDWGVGEFVLSGGEPVLRNDIFEILDFVKEKKYHLGVLSNGILLNNGLINRLLPYLISNSLSLSISLDALTPGIHDSIRGVVGSFEKTSSGLKMISEFKKIYNNINFNTISIILNENLEELLPLAKFLKSLDVNSIQFQPLLGNNLIMKERDKGVKYWIPEERIGFLEDVIGDLVIFKKENPGLVRNSERNLSLVSKYFRGLLDNNDIKCVYADKTMLVANNGDVTTCFDVYGDVRSKSLKKLYFSNEANLARAKVKSCKHPCLLPCFTDYL